MIDPLPLAPAFTVEQADCLDLLGRLPDASVDLILTDPAYSGMNQHLKLGRGRIVGVYKDAGQADGHWFPEFQDDPENFLRLLRACHRVLRNGRHLYIMFDSFSFIHLAPLVEQVFSVKQLIVWDKLNMGMGHYLRRRHELILLASKGHRAPNNHATPDVIRVKRVSRAAYPTQKPVALFSTLLAVSAEPGYVVCDPFLGAGSTAVAALRAGCDFVGGDIGERAVRISRERCEQLIRTGDDPLEPILAGRRSRA